MPQTEQLPAPLNSNRMFVGLFLAAYGLLLVDLLLSQGLAVAWPKLLLGVVFVLVGTLGFARVRRAAMPALTARRSHPRDSIAECCVRRQILP